MPSLGRQEHSKFLAAVVVSAGLASICSVYLTTRFHRQRKPSASGACSEPPVVKTIVCNQDPYETEPRRGYLSWDDYFMSVAFLSAQRSKDPNKQVGACIVSQDQIILSIGYNGFPRGCHDLKLPWAKKAVSGDPLDTKYPYVCHAEMNAIMNKNTASLTGAKLYVTMFPCNECAKLLIQAGIQEVIFYEDKNTKESTSPKAHAIK